MSHTDDQASTVSRGQLRVLGFDNPELEFQLIRELGIACYGGSSVGEVLLAAEQIRNRLAQDPERVPSQCWVEVHEQLAQSLQQQAQAALDAGRTSTARETFFRASMHFRSAEYFCIPATEQHQRLGMASRQTFLDAANLLDVPFLAIQIPYAQASIPAYFICPQHDRQRRKTLIVNTGFDGSSEELYFQVGCAALARGYNVLLIDGPGQTGMTRFHPELKFCPDWETPMKAIVDWLAKRDEVDMAQLALYGISLGGYFALRAACHEPRIKALALNSPILDLKSYELGFFPPDVAQNPPELRLEWLPEIPMTDIPDHVRVATRIAFFRFGCDSLLQWLAKLEAFKVGTDLAKLQIPCLSMVGAAEGGESLKQARQFKAAAPGPVTERVFLDAEGAASHCQFDNLALSNAVLLDWLDAQFSVH